jgi:hypothetical protein
MPRPISGGRYQIAILNADLFPTVNNQIHVTREFGVGTCPYNEVVEHEASHVFDNYEIMRRHRQTLINDLNTLPGPNNPAVANSIADARRERAQIRDRFDKIIDCGMNQACFNIYRLNYSRDRSEYPTSFTDCPEPRPSSPALAPLHLLRVNCNAPPQGCPRPIVRFPW